MAETELDALIARLEAATEGSRELDHAIAEHVPAPDDPRLYAFETGRDWPDNWSTSLDTALTLVPESIDYTHVLIRKNGSGAAAVGRLVTSDPASKGTVNAATPALALVIAALRARALVEGE